MAVICSNSILFLLALCIITGSIPFARALSVVEHPKNASVYNGQSHILNCKFDQPVKCSWNHNEIVTDIKGRYNFISGSGNDISDCSIQISNFSSILDVGRWQCMNKDEDSSMHMNSAIAFISSLNPIQSNRTAILVNGTTVTDIWVPKNGASNGTLTCVAEYAIPAAILYWSLNELNVTSEQILSVCADNGFCNTTLEWPDGDWKQLTSASSLKCNILQDGFPQNMISVNLRGNDNADPDSGSGLQAGAIAGIVIAVVLVIAIIVAILVYCFAVRPRYQNKEVRNIMKNRKNMLSKEDLEQTKPSPAFSVKSNGSSAETVRMNDRQPAPQSPTKTNLLKTAKSEIEDNDSDSASSDESSPMEKGSNPKTPDINNRYSKKFSYASPEHLVFPKKKS